MADGGPVDAIVVGAGIAGLAAAEAILSQGHSVVCLEAAPRAGGLLGTVRDGGFILETGAHGALARVSDSGTSRPPASPRHAPASFDRHARPEGPPGRTDVSSDERNDMASRGAAPSDGPLLDDGGAAYLGLLDWLGVPIAVGKDASRRRLVVHHGRLVPLPSGPPSLLRTPLLSARGKWRLLHERKVPPRASAESEESVDAFAVRRFGAEARPIADALVTGTFAGDPLRTSLDWAFPEVRALERSYGSLLRGMARQARSGGRRALVAPRDGMEALVRALAERVQPKLGVRVQRIRATPGGWTVETSVGPLSSRAVVLATGVDGARALLEDGGGFQRSDSGPRPSPGTAGPAGHEARLVVVGLGFRKDDCRPEKLGYGWIAPESERRFALGVLVESNVFDGRAPAGHVLLRALVGGARHPERAALDDAALVAGVRMDLRSLGVAQASPLWTRVVRTQGGGETGVETGSRIPSAPASGEGTNLAIPQINLGHGDIIAKVDTWQAKHANLAITGAGVRTVSVRELVAEARWAANRVLGAIRAAA